MKFLILLLVPVFLFPQSSITDPPALREAKKSYSQRKYDTAIKQFSAYAESNPGDGVPYLYMGYIYEIKKEFPKSILMFKKAVENRLSPEQKQTTLLKLALYFNYYQEWDQAYVYATRYLAMNPDNKEIIKIRDRAEANRGRTPSRPQPALVQNGQSSFDSKKTRQEYEEILKKNPDDEEARWELALLAFDEKNYNLAEKLLIPLVANHPTKPSYSYKLGVAQIRLQKYNEAIENFNKARPHVPDSDRKFLYFLYLNEGAALFKMKRFTEAEAALKKAYEFNPAIPPLAGLTKVYYNTGKYEDCLEKTNEILKKSPNDMENKMYYVLCRYESSEKDPAILTAFEKELRETYPSADKIPEVYYPILLKLAREHTNSEKYKEAEEYYKVLENDYGQDREYLFYRGKALYYSGNPAEALRYLERVERSVTAIYLSAKAYSRLGNRAKTEEKLLQAASSKPVYWDLALQEEDFADMRKNTEFLKFLKTKGNSVTPLSQPNSRQGPTESPQ